jgi:hypothetical protein
LGCVRVSVHNGIFFLSVARFSDSNCLLRRWRFRGISGCPFSRVFWLLSLLPPSFLEGLLHEVLFILLTENTSSFLSFEQEIVSSRCVCELVFLDFELGFCKVKFVVSFKDAKNFSINWDWFLPEVDCWSIRRSMDNLVVPRVVANISYSKSLGRVRL